MISVIIPCRNGERYLRAAIEALRKQSVDIEIIVVDDGSNDATCRIAHANNCILISNKQSHGPVAAKNAGLKIAKGDYVMFHDHDDIMVDGGLRRLLDELENNPDYSAVQAKVQDFVSPELSEKDKRSVTIKSKPYYGLFTGAILMRRTVWDVLKQFDESVTAGEIIDWQNRMNEYGLRILKIDCVTCMRRVHDSNFGRLNRGTEFKDYAVLLRSRLKQLDSSSDGNMAELAMQIVSRFRSNPFREARKHISDFEHHQNINNLLNGLDADADLHARNLIDKLEKTYEVTMVSINSLYTDEELRCLADVQKFEKSSKPIGNGVYKCGKFKLPIINFEPSVFFYRHGLAYVPNKDGLGSKTIIDAGCYVGDSVLIFRDEFPEAHIVGFEPTYRNYQMALKTLSLNNIENAHIENIGLGDIETSAKIISYESPLKSIENTISEKGNEDIKLTTLDAYVDRHGLRVGLIKTDVEGYEPKLLAGARRTIVEQRPILLISIYHNYHDFYMIKPMLESWNLNYRFDFFAGILNSGNIIVEAMLIATPR